MVDTIYFRLFVFAVIDWCVLFTYYFYGDDKSWIIKCEFNATLKLKKQQQIFVFKITWKWFWLSFKATEILWQNNTSNILLQNYLFYRVLFLIDPLNMMSVQVWATIQNPRKLYNHRKALIMISVIRQLVQVFSVVFILHAHLENRLLAHFKSYLTYCIT